ncbi:hypothetical protein OSB04_027322 [Centaurea solstitialis]|uniref:Cytochrome P450 n=1 Tax=Centaurea solstitialis TaxID=347529 RepID=A0AA38WA52_9ASTR|nr:hypothetical protein OSB04_027322 [Centaurea solstitialis]
MDVFPSWLLSTPFILFSISFILLIHLLRRSISPMASATFHLPPAPPTLPFIGNTHQLLTKNLNRTLWQLAQKYGPVMLIHMGSKPLLVISSSEMTREVLKTHQESLSTRHSNEGTKRLTYNLSDITFAPYGHHWTKMRKVFLSELLGPKRVGWFNQVLKMETESVINILSSNPVNAPVNLNDLFLKLMYGVVCKFAFGKSYREEPFKGLTLKEMLDESTVVLVGSFTDMFPTYRWILDKLCGKNDKLDKCFANLDGYFEMIIDEHLQTVGETSEDEKDVVHALIELSQKDSEFTKDYMKALLLDVLVGAIESTFMTMVWAMSEIVRNPRVMQNLQSEIRRCVGSVGRKTEIDASYISKMTYLKMVIKESLRLHLPAPLLFPRDCSSHCQIGGYDVFPGTCVVINGWGIGRDPRHWKECPNEFYPERFENMEVDFLGNHFEMVPFGGGRRSCPGMKPAISTLELSLVKLFYWFDWEVAGGVKNEDLDMEEEGLLGAHKKSPLCLVPIKHKWEN